MRTRRTPPKDEDSAQQGGDEVVRTHAETGRAARAPARKKWKNGGLRRILMVKDWGEISTIPR